MDTDKIVTFIMLVALIGAGIVPAYLYYKREGRGDKDGDD